MMAMPDTLAFRRPADHLKNLEKQNRTDLPDNSYAIIRVHGKGFSRYTRGLERPSDAKFTRDVFLTQRRRSAEDFARKPWRGAHIRVHVVGNVVHVVGDTKKPRSPGAFFVRGGGLEPPPPFED